MGNDKIGAIARRAHPNDKAVDNMNRTRQRFSLLGGALLASLLSAGVQAAGYAGTQFEIEMVVFSRDNGMSQSRETWPTAPRLGYDSQWVDFDTPSSDDPLVPALQPADNLLNNKAAALRRASGHQVLFHKTWRQVLHNERNAPAVLISGGPRHGEHNALEGSVTLSVSRYLHVSTDLWFMEFDQPPMDTAAPITNQGNSNTPTGIRIPQRPKVTHTIRESEPLGLGIDGDISAPAGFANTSADSPAINSGYSTSADRAVFSGDNYGEASTLTPAPVYASRVAVLREERRLRSGELHYIDHPKLGVLIEVRTVKADPEAD